jgi:hypothetical protein
MTITVQENTERKGIEIIFTQKPAEDIRDEMKQLGFRWHRAKKLWYAKETSERRTFAEGLAIHSMDMEEVEASRAQL